MAIQGLHAKIACLLFFLAFSIGAEAKTPRGTAARYQFVKATACPSTDRHRLPCPGYQVDHIIPLCFGGPDDPANMQWLTVEAHKAKTRLDLKACR